MANRVLRPGLPPGLDAMLEEGFGVPVVPSIGRARAAQLVRRKVEQEAIGCERLDVSELPVRRGALFDMAAKRVPFPEGARYDTCYVALINPDRSAQWGHPAHWAFVPVDGEGDVVVQATNLPENAMGSVRFLPEPGA